MRPFAFLAGARLGAGLGRFFGISLRGWGGVASSRFTVRSNFSWSCELVMSQPINRVIRDPEVFLDRNILDDKPEMAILVARIFSTWGWIEHELSLLLVRILGANADAALAIVSTLQAQHLQLGALEAAAKASLSPDNFEVFQAVIAVTNSVQKPRNRLAHWIWGGCKQSPDAMVLADPKMLKEKDFVRSKFFDSLPTGDLLKWDEVNNLYQPDLSSVYLYSKGDLERALRDLNEAREIVFEFDVLLDPLMKHGILGVVTKFDPDWLRAEVFRRLSARRLFHEALDRIRATRKSNPP
jgi:hypothetical protein